MRFMDENGFEIQLNSRAFAKYYFEMNIEHKNVAAMRNLMRNENGRVQLNRAVWMNQQEKGKSEAKKKNQKCAR